MAFICETELTIGNVQVNGVHAFRVESSLERIADTCTITLPFLRRAQSLGIEEAIRLDDRVRLRARYKGMPWISAFDGFVRRLAPGAPLQIMCDTVPPSIRRGVVERKYMDITLRTLIKELVKGTGIRIDERAAPPDYDFGSVRVDGSIEQALQKLAGEHGLFIHLTPDVVRVAIRYGPPGGYGFGPAPYTAEQVFYDLSKNVSDDELVYKQANERLMRIWAIGKYKGRHISVEVGNRLGAWKTLYFHNVNNTKALRTLALQAMQRLTYAGFEGSFTGWLYPQATVGQIVDLKDPIYGRRGGGYFLTSTTLGFSLNGGFRRNVVIGERMYSHAN